MSSCTRSLLLIHTIISLYVHNSSHVIMCLSKTLKEKPPMATFLEEYKLSEEFESNCDYIEMEVVKRAYLK